MNIIAIIFGLLFGIFILPNLKMIWAVIMIVASVILWLVSRPSTPSSTNTVTPNEQSKPEQPVHPERVKVKAVRVKPTGKPEHSHSHTGKPVSVSSSVHDNESLSDGEDNDYINPIHINYRLMREQYEKSPAGSKLPLDKMVKYIDRCADDFILLYAYFLNENESNPLTSAFSVFLRCFPAVHHDYYTLRFNNMVNRSSFNEPIIKSGKESKSINIFVENVTDEIEYKMLNGFTTNQLFHIVTQIQCWLLFALTSDSDERILSVVTDIVNQENTYNKILEKTKSHINHYDNSKILNERAVYLRKAIYDTTTN